MTSTGMPYGNCPICSGTTRWQNRLYDDRYGYPGYFDLLECVFCGHRFLNVQFADSQLTDLYTNYYPRSSFDESKFKPANVSHGFRAWLDGDARFAYSWVPEKVRVLDIGCGFGETLAFHVARGCDAYGVEADQNIRRVLSKFGFNIHVGLFDSDVYEPCFFDYVTMDQVVEHFTDPVSMIEGIAQILKPGGSVVISTPNANGWGAYLFNRCWINWHAPYHLHFFSERSMQIAAERAGLIVERARTLTSSEWLHFQWNHILLNPSMGESSPFWSHKAKRGMREKLILRMLSFINRTKGNHLVTRFFDALGRGDNYLFFLRKP